MQHITLCNKQTNARINYLTDLIKVFMYSEQNMFGVNNQDRDILDLCLPICCTAMTKRLIFGTKSQAIKAWNAIKTKNISTTNLIIKREIPQKTASHIIKTLIMPLLHSNYSKYKLYNFS